MQETETGHGAATPVDHTPILTTVLRLNRRARHFMRDSQAIHRTLAHALDGRGLWGTPSPTTLVVRHDSPVDWLTTMPGVVAQATTTPTRVPITGEHVDYALIANPTYARCRGDGGRGKIAALPPERWKTWAERRLTPALNLHTVDCEVLPTAIGLRHGRRVTTRRVLYTGHATVRSQAELATLMRDGVGRGKAYGCGLLLVEAA